MIEFLIILGLFFVLVAIVVEFFWVIISIIVVAVVAAVIRHFDESAKINGVAVNSPANFVCRGSERFSRLFAFNQNGKPFV